MDKIPPRGARVLVGVALLAAFALARAGEVTVAVAANFAGPFARIGEAFTAATGHTLKVSTGSTGAFLAQIRSAAPFEVLLAADADTPRQLVAEGLAVPASNFTYAIGRLALWSAQPGVVDGQGAVLASGRFAHIAIANPQLAPYGAAGMETLRSLGLAQALAPRIVTAESIAQAYQFVASGNAEIGFVALSQVAIPGKPVVGSYWLVPTALYHPVRQDAVLLKAGQQNPAAVALLDFLKGDAAKATIQAWGYGR